MRGSIRQRGESWELRVFLGCDGASGRKQYATKTVRGGKREAQRALAELVTQATEGRLTAGRATVGQLLEEWYEHTSANFSPKTALEVRGIIDRHLLVAFGAVPLRRVRAQDIDAFYRDLRMGRATASRPLKPATIKRIHGVLRAAMQQGIRWGWITVNPAAAASPPRVDAPEIRPPSPAELARLFQEATTAAPELATFVVVAAATGARRSELIALRWSDLDLENRRIEFARGIVRGRDGLVEKDTKVHAARTVSIDATTADVLAEHRRQMTARAALCGAELSTGSFVFSDSPRGTQPWPPDSTTRRFTQIRRRCGLRSVRLHDLRHYVATTMLTAGVDVRTVAGRLGHRNASTTLNVYSHFLEAADRDAADLLGRILEEARKPGANAVNTTTQPTPQG